MKIIERYIIISCNFCWFLAIDSADASEESQCKGSEMTPPPQI